MLSLCRGFPQRLRFQIDPKIDSRANKFNFREIIKSSIVVTVNFDKAPTPKKYSHGSVEERVHFSR